MSLESLDKEFRKKLEQNLLNVSGSFALRQEWIARLQGPTAREIDRLDPIMAEVLG